MAYTDANVVRSLERNNEKKESLLGAREKVVDDAKKEKHKEGKEKKRNA